MVLPSQPLTVLANSRGFTGSLASLSARVMSRSCHTAKVRVFLDHFGNKASLAFFLQPTAVVLNQLSNLFRMRQ